MRARRSYASPSGACGDHELAAARAGPTGSCPETRGPDWG
jgi:hypothetical protein